MIGLWAETSRWSLQRKKRSRNKSCAAARKLFIWRALAPEELNQRSSSESSAGNKEKMNHRPQTGTSCAFNLVLIWLHFICSPAVPGPTWPYREFFSIENVAFLRTTLRNAAELMLMTLFVEMLENFKSPGLKAWYANVAFQLFKGIYIQRSLNLNGSVGPSSGRLDLCVNLKKGGGNDPQCSALIWPVGLQL